MSRAPDSPGVSPGMEKGTTVERKPCPRCGDEYANIPNHLRHCDGESDD